MRANLRRAFSVFLLAVLAYGAVTLVPTSDASACCGGCQPPCALIHGGCQCPP
jgi:hypothetical protein